MVIYRLTVGAFALLFLLYFLYTRQKHEQELEKIEQVLDDIINDNYAAEVSMYNEGAKDRLIFKAIRIAEANKSYRQQAVAEKAGVQELIADISHQMRTPITSIVMFAELLQSEGLAASEAKEFLARISFDSKRLNWLVSEFLQMVKLEMGTLPMNLQKVPLASTIRRALQQSTDAKQRERFEVSCPVLTVSHDVKWTSEALSNVLDNALKYAFPDSPITIEVDQLSFYTRIRVTNQGPTIPAEELPKIFTKYFRGSQKEKSVEGFGIGLYLTRLIVEAQGGYVLAESANQRTTLSLFLQN
ncbi:sensor histidine kinase [Enterococcus sp. AZ109]|uniref:sensor histidine kinase n=1 Tax=Enterococcus sp. AZ109 TaxID=2774634 RepID=UPI003F287E7B